jgi:SAM-dependent methyltransferase/alpha-beta hydrolase superfamily lysophospholipase/ribosome-associated toxin RatA of RatAB toxin-antitoxin module
MITAKATIFINKDCRKVFSAIKEIGEYPTFMLNVESVSLSAINKNSSASEWKININETLITWQQKEHYNERKLQIKFTGIKGDLLSLNALWELFPSGQNRTQLSLSVKLDLGGIVTLRYSDTFLLKRVRAIVKATLRAFKRKLDYGIEIDKGEHVLSEPITYKNHSGKNIVGYFDHLKHCSPQAPFVILPPGYGETKRDTLSTAYFLAKNGFNCIRYDATNHVGESDGEIIHATLTSMKNDLLATIDYVTRRFPIKKVGVVATSLANRMALKAAAEDKRIILLVSVVGVVNLQNTLCSVYKEDMVNAFLQGERWGPTDILGLKVNFENFLSSAVSDEFHTLESTFYDMGKLRIPVVFLVAENDVWVKAQDVQLVFEKKKGRNKELLLIPEAMHQLQENPRAARIVMKQIVSSCHTYLRKQKIEFESILEPNIREIAIQNRAEKERLRLKEVFALNAERDFWGEYLTSFSAIYTSPDYREYLTLLYELLNGIKDGDQILDAGCGVGYFSAWLIYKIIKANEKSPQKQPQLFSRCRYYGIDFVPSALETAQRHSTMIKQETLRSLGLNGESLESFFPTFYRECDLNFDLPFEDGYFQKVCSSLVLSYLNEPLLTAKELLRVLKPGGKIVISSLKPFADLSEIYRRFVDVAKNEQELLDARRLLSEAGSIRQKEGMGCYHFFAEKELKFILLAAGAKKVKTYRSLGNQVNVAEATK